eukprot:scaffold354778_cov26-Prasinocladus_malaysianus.AAC.2
MYVQPIPGWDPAGGRGSGHPVCGRVEVGDGRGGGSRDSGLSPPAGPQRWPGAGGPRRLARRSF